MPQLTPHDLAEARRIQDLVDEHTIILVPQKEIAAHLREVHDVAPDALIPPPSKRALRERERFMAGDHSVLTRFGAKVIASGGTVQPAELKQAPNMGADDAAARPALPSGADVEKAFLAAAERLRIKYPSVKAQVFDDTPEHWSDSFEAFARTTYVPIGPTFLDRYIQGSGGLQIREGQVEEGCTKFEAASLPLRRFLDEDPEWGATPVSRLVWRDGGETAVPAAYIDLALAPWLLGSQVTENVQIDADLAEIFLQANPPSNSDWQRELCTMPFYVDIKQDRAGERTISGIFCTPHRDGSGFSCLVAVEWVQQGIESYLLYEHGDEDVRVFNTTDCDSFPESAMTALYEPIHKDAMHIVAMARLHFKGLSFQQREGNLLRRASTGEVTSGHSRRSDKKTRAQEKTHSYFRVLRIETPANRFGQRVARRSSWSLDHLVTVNGHFRWQPHGPGRSQHRLIWIDAYDKGAGGRHRPDTNPVLLTSSDREA